MSETRTPATYASAHVAWLVCLYAVLSKVRREGLLAVEADVESPLHPEAVFARYPQTQVQPYLEFASDVLRMMVGGNLNGEELGVYAEHYIAGLKASGGGVDESLLRTIWLSLWAGMCGYAPQVAVEFGRQGVPVKLKPSFVELEELLREARAREQQRAARDVNGFDAAVERFVASLGG